MTLPLLLSPLFSFLLISLLSSLAPQAIALLAILIFIFNFKKRHWQLTLFFASVLCNLLIFQTGYLNSTLFFLLYPLLFAISLFFSPTISLSYTAVLALLLSPSLNSGTNLITLSSLFLISPLALLFGQQYLKNLVQDQKILDLRQKDKKTAQQLAHQETNTLLWLTLKLHPTLTSLQESLSLLLSDLSHLTPFQHQELEQVHQKMKKLQKSAHQLQKDVDLETDESKS